MKTKFMKIMIALAAVALMSACCFAQTVDTVIDKGIYKSYFCKNYHEPLYVTYPLYKAGGKGSRVGMTFKNDSYLVTATAKGYAGSGYDEGHLADAADFSYNRKAEESTFRFYNALPQTPNLNRGIWKHYETEIREESQKDSLFIICGGIFSKDSKKLKDGSYVPDKCWKIIYNKHSKKVEKVMLFTNDANATETDTDMTTLEGLTGWQLHKLIK